MPKSSFKKSLRAFWARRRSLVLKTGFVAALLAVIAAGALYILPDVVASFAPKLDLKRDLYAMNRPAAFTFLDAEGREIGHRGAIVGERLTLEQMPAYVPAAFIAPEDRRFYDHHGFDPKGLWRAAWVNWRAGHVVQGGSTITQQLAKILFLTSDRTYSRKMNEVMDAAAIEQELSKKQILELYLNRIYLGPGAYGVDGASRVYFGKSARDLTLSQAAMLATLTRAPSAFIRFERNEEPVFRKFLAQHRRPFDENDMIGQEIVETELDHFGRIGDAIEIEMGKLHSPLVINLQERKAGAWHFGFRRVHDGADKAAGEAGFSRTQAARKQDEILGPGAQRQFGAKRQCRCLIGQESGDSKSLHPAQRF